MTNDILEEVCQNCIWWVGDCTGDQGACTNDTEGALTTGRYESCVSCLTRSIDDANIDWDNYATD